MNGNCHFIFGTSIGVSIAINLSTINQYVPQIANTPEMGCLFVMGGIMGGIFPDIDAPQSYMGKLSYPVSRYIYKFSKFFGNRGKYHRGLLHDPFLYLLCIGFAYFYYPSLLGFFIGCLSHTYLDMFNPVGIPFMFGLKHLKAGKIKSASKECLLFTWFNSAGVIAVGLIFFFKMTYNEILSAFKEFAFLFQD